MISSKIIADSTFNDSRLTTYVLTMPKFLFQELNKHRVFSSNAASSRAIPNKKMKELACFSPLVWGKNKSGMQAEETLSGWRLIASKSIWESAKRFNHLFAEALSIVGCHKQISNRLIEPFTYGTVILSGTYWMNFFNLRCEAAAEPHFGFLASLMLEQYLENVPHPLYEGEWHIPFIKPEEASLPLRDRLVKSSARCARVSYNNFYGKDSMEDDLRLYESLKSQGHWTPYEHQAQAVIGSNCNGNFSNSWRQHRQMLENSMPKRDKNLKSILEEQKVLNKERGI